MMSFVSHIPKNEKPNIQRNSATHKSHDKPIQKIPGWGVTNFEWRRIHLEKNLTPAKLPKLSVKPTIKPIKIPKPLSAFHPDSILKIKGVVKASRLSNSINVMPY